MNEKRFLGKSRFARIGKKTGTKEEEREEKLKERTRKQEKVGRRGENERKTQGTLQTTYPCQEVTRKQERFQ